MLDQRCDAAALSAQTDAEARSTLSVDLNAETDSKRLLERSILSNECRLKLVSCGMQCSSWPPRSSPRIPSQEEPGQATARCANEG